MTPEEIRQKIVKRERRVKLAIFLGIIISCTTILLAVPGMLVSFLLAFAVTYLFKPIVTYFERKGLGRTISVLIPFLLTGLLVSAGSSFLIPKISQQSAALQIELPKYVTGINDIIKKRTKKLTETLSPFTKVDIGEKAGKWVENSSAMLLNNIPNWVSQLLSTMILAPFFAFFMLRDGQKISRGLLALVPNNLFEMALNLFYQINQQLGGFIRARLLEAVFVGSVVWIGLYFLGFPYATLLAVFAGITNQIPYVGPLIGAVPGLIVALVNHDPSSTVALVGLVYVVAQGKPKK